MLFRSMVLLLVSLSLLSAEAPFTPNYLLIGAQKGGTTALFEYINQHPMTINKVAEVHYFDVNFTKGLNWYKNKFPKRPSASYVMGDKSPYYLFHPAVPARVYQTFPGIKLIVILRNPVSRAYSHYWFNKNRGLERLEFEEAIRAESTRLEGEEQKIMEDPDYKGRRFRRRSYLARGRYAEQLERWYSYFPQDQILVIFSNDLRKSPQDTMDRVFSFLGLPAYKVNTKNKNSHTDYPPLPDAMKTELEAYFKPYNEELEALLDQTITW